MANSNRHEIIDLTGESTAPVPKPHPRSTAAKKGATKTDPITVDLEDEEPAETPSRAQPTVNLPTRSLSGSAKDTGNHAPILIQEKTPKKHQSRGPSGRFAKSAVKLDQRQGPEARNAMNQSSSPPDHQAGLSCERIPQNTLSATKAGQTEPSGGLSAGLEQPQEHVNPDRCMSCADDGLQCDGEKPCSRNQQLHNSTYKALASSEDKLTQRSKQNEDSSIKSPSFLLPSIPNSPSMSDSSLFPVSDLIPSPDSRFFATPKSLPVNRTSKAADTVQEIRQPNEVLNAGPEQLGQEHWKPFEPQGYNDVLSIVKRFQEDLYLQREYWLEGELRRALVKNQHRTNAPASTLKVSPWKQRVAEVKANGTNQNADGYISVMVKMQADKTFKTIQVPYTRLEADKNLSMLPRYKSIGRMGHAFLSKNIHTLKSEHYFPEDEQIQDEGKRQQQQRDLKDAYQNPKLAMSRPKSEKQAQIFDRLPLNPELVFQRRCIEQAERWSEAFQQMCRMLGLTTELVGDCASTVDAQMCQSCKIAWKQSEAHKYGPTDEVTKLITHPSWIKCTWLKQALIEVTGMALWHFVELMPTGSLGRLSAGEQREHDIKPSLCAICLLPNCLTHGSYKDNDKDNDEDHRRAIFVDDPENRNNTRTRIVVNRQSNDKKQQHLCGLYCLPQTEHDHSLADVLSCNTKGEWTGLRNDKVTMSTAFIGFRQGKPCERKNCFLSRDNRDRHDIHSAPVPTTEQRSRLIEVVRLFSCNARLPCLLATRLKTDCMVAFTWLLALHTSPAHEQPDMEPKPQKTYDTSVANYLDGRKPFVPCSHTGPCDRDREQTCSCAGDKVFCEFFCGCDESCGRRFPGCDCRKTNQICFKDDRCECWAQNRECDPWLCKCDVAEILDPSNKYNYELAERRGACRNNHGLRDVPARTIKAESDVQGWGLYAGVDMPKNTYIGEYKGEIITMSEGSRRGVVYHSVGQEYLFVVNEEQEIDGSNFGNKTRFMNNSERKEYINIWAHKLFSNGVSRVLFFTSRVIKAGEELLYHYNYPKEVSKHFWEKGEKRRANELVPIPKPKADYVKTPVARQTKRKVKKKRGDSDSASSRSSSLNTDSSKGKRRQSDAEARKQKRKRNIVEEEEKNEEDWTGFMPVRIDRALVPPKTPLRQVQTTDDLDDEEGTRPADDEYDSDEDVFHDFPQDDEDDDEDEYEESEVEESSISEPEPGPDTGAEEDDEVVDETDEDDKPLAQLFSPKSELTGAKMKRQRRVNPATDKRFRRNWDENMKQKKLKRKD